jgi:outer membrane murein-binding lipoprotein Lpp
LGVRAQLAWIARGGSTTSQAIDSLSTDLRALQEQVARLETAVNAVRDAQVSAADRQLDDIDALRAAVAAATDDLVQRVNAVDARHRSAT